MGRATHQARQPQGILAAFLLQASLGLGTSPYTKDADTAKSSVRPPFPPPPTAGAQEGKDAQVGGGRSGWEDLPTHQLDKQPMKGWWLWAGLGLGLVSAALPYLTQQLATAPPRE